MSTATARINMRITPAARDLIEDAAEVQGTDMTAFVVAAATQQARRVLLEERALKVSAAEALQIQALLSEDREPTDALKRAMERLSVKQ